LKPDGEIRPQIVLEHEGERFDLVGEAMPRAAIAAALWQSRHFRQDNRATAASMRQFSG
jgi:hypothetical protein